MSRQQTQVLKLRLEPENFSAGRTAFQGLANDAKTGSGAISTLNTNIQTVSKSTDAVGSKIRTNVTAPLEQLDKTTTSLGGKIANFGKKFAGSVANAGALGGQIFNLSRQYQDLSDTQIRVDRTSLKMSKTAEAETKARNKLNALVAQGVTGGAAYEQAVTDVQQAEEAATLAVTMHGEALEDQQRAYENFAMNLAPTVVQAGGTIITMFKDLGGTKGFGGIATKIKGLVTGGGGLGSLTGALSNMSGGFSGAEASAGKFSKATEFLKANITSLIGVMGGLAGAAVILEIGAKAQTILDKMSTSNVGKRGGLIQAALGDPEQIKIQSMAIAEYDAIVKKTDIAGINLLYDAIFGTSTVQTAAKNAGIIDKQGKILKDAAVAAIDLGKDFKMTATEYADSALTMLESGKSVAEVTKYLTEESFIPQEKALVILDLALTKFNATLRETGRAYATLDQALGRKSIIDTFFPPNTQQALLQAATQQLGPSGRTIIGFMEDQVEKVRKAEIQQKIFQAIFGEAGTQTGAGGAFAEFQARGEKAVTDYIARLKNALEKGADTTKEGEAFAAYGQKATAALASVEAQMIKNANAATLLDQNFKPLPDTVQQLVGPLKQAEANLKASGSGINALVAAAQGGIATVDTWIAQQKLQIKQDESIQKTYYERAKALGATMNAQSALNITEKSAVETMQLWIQYTIAIEQGNKQAAASFFQMYKDAILAEKGLKGVTGAAKEIRYGPLIPANKKLGIPEGGRSGKQRIRSDYQRPLIGSPEAQRQMILGQRPKVFAGGAWQTELARLASKINIGDTMNKQGDKYAQGVGKMITANTKLKTDLGNMPASLIPVTNAVANIPKNVAPATTATNAMSQALKNIPKATAPKVTATVQGQSAVNEISRSLANIPKTVTTTVRVKVGGSSQVAPTSRFYKPVQHGYHGTVKRPTLFMAGEGGRYEDISVNPRGSGPQTQRGGGGFNGSVNVFIGNRRLMTDIRYAINDNQGVVK
jgi:uncharacterized protein (UPF0212 family)